SGCEPKLPRYPPEEPMYRSISLLISSLLIFAILTPWRWAELLLASQTPAAGARFSRLRRSTHLIAYLWVTDIVQRVALLLRGLSDNNSWARRRGVPAANAVYWKEPRPFACLPARLAAHRT